MVKSCQGVRLWFWLNSWLNTIGLSARALGRLMGVEESNYRPGKLPSPRAWMGKFPETLKITDWWGGES